MWADLGRFERLDCFRQSDLGHRQSSAYFLHFGCGLLFAFRKEGARSYLHLDAQPEQFIGESVRKAIRNINLPDPLLAQEGSDYLGKTGSSDSVMTEKSLTFAQRDCAAVRSLGAGAVNLEIAQHDHFPAANTKVDEWIRDKHPHGV